MELQINSKNHVLTSEERRQIERKLTKLDRYLPQIADARFEIIHEPTRCSGQSFAARLSLNSNGTQLNGEERGGDVLTAVERLTEAMHRRIEHFKGKLYDRRQGKLDRASIKTDSAGETEETVTGQVVKYKRFAIKPTTVDDAIHDMEELGHDFFLFFNAETEKLSVVYRRYDNNYGLIEPDMG